MIAGNHKVIEALLGSVNVSFLSLSDLTNDDVKRAGIKGKMLNISHESGKDVNANVLKQLTSGERVLIKHLNVDPCETAGYGKFIADCDAVEEWTEPSARWQTWPTLLSAISVVGTLRKTNLNFT